MFRKEGKPMASIMTAIQMYDGMSPVLNHIMTALNTVIHSFERMENVSRHSIDTTAVREARTELTRAQENFSHIEESIQRASAEQENFNQSIQNGSIVSGKLKGLLEKATNVIGIDSVLKSADDQQKAQNLYQTKTGVGSVQTQEMNEGMKNLYMNNMGDSFEDIANSMAAVTQITGQTGKALENTTNSALLMRDTFEFDVTESVRAVDMMQRQFGLTSAEAYDQIIQGAQAGLDKNGDLLNTITKYSVHFKKMGFESTDMFNMLINGAKNGTFSVDKLGEAVKEFSVKAVDGSNTTADGFKAIGLDVKEMEAQFGMGGESAKKAFQKTVESLESMKDPVQQNIAGVNLFGTMWEDLGASGVFALADIDGAVDKTTEHLKAIQEVRYDSASEALAALGRTINVYLGDAMSDVVHVAAQYIQDFTAGLQGNIENIEGVFGRIGLAVRDIGTFFSDNWGIIEPVIWGIVAAMGMYITMLGIQKGLILASTLAEKAASLNTAIHTAFRERWTVAAFKQTIMQGKLNAALMACPITWIIAAIIAFIVIIYVAVAAINKFANKSYSATGVIVGAFMAAAAFIGNLLISVFNFTSGAIIEVANLFAKFANFIGNLFNNPVGAIVKLFADLFDFIVGIVQDAAGLLDTIFGSSLSNAVKGFRSDFNKAVDKVVGNNYIEYAPIQDQDDVKLKRLEYGKAFDYGYGLGKDFAKGVKDKFNINKTFEDAQKQADNYKDDQYQSIANNTGDTAKNTEKLKDAVSTSSEDLKYLRDIASQKSINRFTTAEIKVNMTNHNNINSGMDADEFCEHVRTTIENDAMKVAAKGVW